MSHCLGEESFRIDEFEAVRRLECIPLVDITMHENRPRVVVSIDPARSATQRIIDGALRARATELLPRSHGVIDEIPTLVGAARCARSRRSAPSSRRATTFFA